MDYRVLLAHYMEEVVLNEGVHFADQPCVVLTEDESAELLKIWQDVKPHRGPLGLGEIGE